MSEQEMQMKLASQQEKIKALRQEVAEMNKEREFWQHYRIQASIAAMQTIADALGSVDYNKELIAKHAVELADALIEELKKGWEDD